MKAFSLVELAIVLVLLGLIVGGILVGQNLIHASTLRSVSTDIQKYQTAISGFREQFAALPGDFGSAQRYWGVGASCPSNTTGGTCNGNNDGIVYCSPDYTGCEYTYSAQHLGLAGLIAGSYNPNWPAADPLPMKTYAFPLKLDRASLTYGYHPVDPATQFDNFVAGHYIYVSALATTGYYSGYRDPVIACVDAWNIDTKMDDGKPGTGNMTSIRTSCTTDTTGANFATSAYAVGTNGTTMLHILTN